MFYFYNFYFLTLLGYFTTESKKNNNKDLIASSADIDNTPKVRMTKQINK